MTVKKDMSTMIHLMTFCSKCKKSQKEVEEEAREASDLRNQLAKKLPANEQEALGAISTMILKMMPRNSYEIMC